MIGGNLHGEKGACDTALWLVEKRAKERGYLGAYNLLAYKTRRGTEKEILDDFACIVPAYWKGASILNGR